MSQHLLFHYHIEKKKKEIDGTLKPHLLEEVGGAPGCQRALADHSQNPWESIGYKEPGINLLIGTACHAWPTLLGCGPVGGFIY